MESSRSRPKWGESEACSALRLKTSLILACPAHLDHSKMKRRGMQATAQNPQCIPVHPSASQCIPVHPSAIPLSPLVQYVHNVSNLGIMKLKILAAKGRHHFLHNHDSWCPPWNVHALERVSGVPTWIYSMNQDLDPFWGTYYRYLMPKKCIFFSGFPDFRCRCIKCIIVCCYQAAVGRTKKSHHDPKHLRLKAGKPRSPWPAATGMICGSGAGGFTGWAKEQLRTLNMPQLERCSGSNAWFFWRLRIWQFRTGNRLQITHVK